MGATTVFEMAPDTPPAARSFRKAIALSLVSGFCGFSAAEGSALHSCSV
jgi:hypothetical protein